MCNFTNTQGISIGSEPRNVWDKPSLGGFQVLEICTQSQLQYDPQPLPTTQEYQQGHLVKSVAFRLRQKVLPST